MTSAPQSFQQMTDELRHAPTPWELIEATEHHGAYIVNSWGRTICDLYAMSNPMAASVRNGGTSFPVHFDDMAPNAALIVEAVNSHEALKARIHELETALDEIARQDDPDLSEQDLRQHDRHAGFSSGLRHCADMARAALSKGAA